MTINRIKEIIKSSDSPELQKNVMIGFVERAKLDLDKIRKDRKLIEQVAKENNISEIILSTDDVKIYTVSGNFDEWRIKYPYRTIYLNENGAWRSIHTVAQTFDEAYLIYLEHKYLGLNSQFSFFAAKMLGIAKD